MNKKRNSRHENPSESESQLLNFMLNNSHNEINELFEIKTKDILIEPFDIKPDEDYEAPLHFPDCCEYHRTANENAQEWYLKFPHCCKAHEELSKKFWFNKEKYKTVPEKIIKQLSYTEHHISKYLDTEEWYKEITDYIEYNFFSFGQPTVGQDRYYILLKYYLDNLKHNKRIDAVKYNRLKEYLNAHTKPKLNENKGNIYLLQSIFQKWIHLIPNIDIFSKIKELYRNKIPMSLFLHEHEYNKYLGTSKATIRTDSELLDLLLDITKEVLTKINNEINLSENSILDVNKKQIIILNESHRINQTNLLENFSRGEVKYLNIIKGWLKNENMYFQSLKPLLIETKTMTKEVKDQQKKKILFLTANPVGTDSLRLEDEIRAIMEELKSSTYRDRIEIIYEPSVKISTITKAMAKHSPSIVHFSGHGSGVDGLCVLNDNKEIEYLSTFALHRLFKLYKKSVKCILLNACYSVEQAKAISQNNIYVIGMNNSISDQAATNFSTGFYQSIAEEKGIKFAYEIGLVHVSTSNDEISIPELWKDGKKVKTS